MGLTSRPDASAAPQAKGLNDLAENIVGLVVGRLQLTPHFLDRGLELFRRHLMRLEVRPVIALFEIACDAKQRPRGGGSRWRRCFLIAANSQAGFICCLDAFGLNALEHVPLYVFNSPCHRITQKCRTTQRRGVSIHQCLAGVRPPPR